MLKFTDLVYYEHRCRVAIKRYVFTMSVSFLTIFKNKYSPDRYIIFVFMFDLLDHLGSSHSIYTATDCDPVFVFDRDYMSPQLVIASNQLTLKNTANKKWNTARINVKMVSGLHKWEVHIDR
jgi:hypothetical protein